MSYRRLPPISESEDDLAKRLRAERNPERKARLHLLLLIKRQVIASQAQAAEHLARHRNTISNWLASYREGGLEALLRFGKRGKPPGQRLLTAPVFAALQDRLNTDEGFSGYHEIQQWLHSEYALKVPYQSIYTLVRYRLSAKLKTPRPEHPKKA